MGAKKPLPYDEMMAARMPRGAGLYILARPSGDGSIHVIDEYRTKAAAERHRAGLAQYDNWADAKVYARAELEVTYRIKEGA